LSVLSIRSRFLSRNWLTALAVVVLVAGAYGFVHLGAFLAREDPLMRADAIFVLAGTRVERPLEAADLYLAGYAPRVLLTRSRAEADAYRIARARGAQLEDEFDSEAHVLESLGVPTSSIVSLSRTHDNTGEEAATLRQIALR
jgi:uncharacterized SAM-binding protein YcdF (DUF218 family)